jgi:hypothetical protein
MYCRYTAEGKAVPYILKDAQKIMQVVEAQTYQK